MQKKSKSGFTLIELLVVVLIIGILSAVALPQYSTAVEKSRATEALALMNAVAGAAERYYFQKDAWPTAFSQLDIEVPAISGTTHHGGKNFQFSLCAIPQGDTCTITATRTSGGADYTLTTTLQDNSSTETIVRTRSCQGTGKGATYCDAITNGHNTDF